MSEKPMNINQLIKIATELGSDCPFFIRNEPAIVRGRGEILSRIKLPLKGFYLVLLNPGITVETAWAYANSKPNEHRPSLEALLREPVTDWKNHIENDFEEIVIQKHPAIQHLKEELYNSGAVYASMSGSGSSVYGLFYRKPSTNPIVAKHLLWEGII